MGYIICVLLVLVLYADGCMHWMTIFPYMQFLFYYAFKIIINWLKSIIEDLLMLSSVL